MTETVLLTVLCLLCGGAIGAALTRKCRAARRSARADDETDERLVTLEELVDEFDHMLIRKGLMTGTQLALIRTGARSHGIVTGLRATGMTREDYREVELDLMVSRRGGGQFPVRQRTLIPVSALPKVAPGSVIDAYYRPGDEHSVAVCVSPT